MKVSDAKAAFERRSSISQEAKPDFSLASTINVNKLVQNELNKDKEPKDEDKIRKENAVKVSNYIFRYLFTYSVATCIHYSFSL